MQKPLVIFLLGIDVWNTTNGYTFTGFISRAHVHMALLTIPRCIIMNFVKGTHGCRLCIFWNIYIYICLGLGFIYTYCNKVSEKKNYVLDKCYNFLLYIILSLIDKWKWFTFINNMQYCTNVNRCRFTYTYRSRYIYKCVHTYYTHMCMHTHTYIYSLKFQS